MKLKYMIPALGIILFSGIAKADNDTLCREYVKTINIGGRTQQGYGTACLQADGSWEIVSEDDNLVAINQSYPQDNTQYIVRREYVNTSPFTISLFGNLGGFNHGYHRHDRFCGHRGRGNHISYNTWNNHGHNNWHGNRGHRDRDHRGHRGHRDRSHGNHH